MSDQTITSLIEKLEGAEVGSRELDLDVAQALNMKLWGRRHPSNNSHQWMTEIAGRSVPMPRFSTSLDAALALAERVLPGWAWNIDRWGKMSRVTLNECDAEGWHKSTHRRIEVAAEQTPALALCAAIIRAQSEARV